MKPITERIRNIPEDIPSEVWMVWIIEYMNQPIGLELYKQCEETIKKYPQYFKNEQTLDNNRTSQ